MSITSNYVLLPHAGELVKSLRAEEMSKAATSTSWAMRAANNFGALTAVVRPFLNTVDLAHRIVGPGLLSYTSGLLNRLSGHLIPAWVSLVSGEQALPRRVLPSLQDDERGLLWLKSSSVVQKS